MKLYSLFKANAILIATALLFILITINTSIVFYNDRVLEETNKIKKQTEYAKKLTDEIWTEVVKNLDLGLRAFALGKQPGLLSPYDKALAQSGPMMDELRQVLKEQNFEHPQGVEELIEGINNIIKDDIYMLGLLKNDSMQQFMDFFALDRGYEVWKVYDKNSKLIHEFEDKLFNQAVDDYKAAVRGTLIAQIILWLIGCPTLLFVGIRIVRDKKERAKLFLELDTNNREYLFNPGDSQNLKNEKELIENSILNYKNATEFIRQVSDGNLQVEWQEINDQNRALNKNNLTGELIKMREKMKEIKAQDERRVWASEGLTKLSQVIREHQHALSELSDHVLSFIIKYLNAHQGGMFILREVDDRPDHLEMTSCFAYNRKKFINKRIELGEGLVGQTFLEEETTFLIDIPEDYSSIDSGLGGVKPKCIVIVPLKYNQKVEAMIELGSLNVLEAYHIDFLEKVGEIIASTLGAVKNSEKTNYLLEQFKEQTERLKSQEEELRQNMEEMQATQEAIVRAEKEAKEIQTGKEV